MRPARTSFNGLFRSEARKAATTPVTYGLLAAILAMTALNTALSLSDPLQRPRRIGHIRHALSAGRDFMILFVALGAVGAAGEFRHGTAIPTFLATPVRRRVVTAKLATYLTLGLLVALSRPRCSWRSRSRGWPPTATASPPGAPTSPARSSPTSSRAPVTARSASASACSSATSSSRSSSPSAGSRSPSQPSRSSRPGSLASSPAAPSPASTPTASTSCRSTRRYRCWPPTSPPSACSPSAPPCDATSPNPRERPGLRARDSRERACCGLKTSADRAGERAVDELLTPDYARFSPHDRELRPAPAAAPSHDGGVTRSRSGGRARCCGVAVAADEAELGLALALLSGVLALASRRALRLAARSRVGAESEGQVRRALKPLTREGWRVAHAVDWPGRGDLDHVLLSPLGLGFVIETKTLRYSRVHVLRTFDAARWLARKRRRYPCGVLPVVCVTRARRVERLEEQCSSCRSTASYPRCARRAPCRRSWSTRRSRERETADQRPAPRG